jgi:hypothetical protein
MAATIAGETTARKPRTAYYAVYYDEAGMLTQVAGTLYFIGATTQDITEVELETLSFLVVLGRCDLADSQWVEDIMNGGAPAIACSREEGVH